MYLINPFSQSVHIVCYYFCIVSYVHICINCMFLAVASHLAVFFFSFECYIFCSLFMFLMLFPGLIVSYSSVHTIPKTKKHALPLRKVYFWLTSPFQDAWDKAAPYLILNWISCFTQKVSCSGTISCIWCKFKSKGRQNSLKISINRTVKLLFCCWPNVILSGFEMNFTVLSELMLNQIFQNHGLKDYLF